MPAGSAQHCCDNICPSRPTQQPTDAQAHFLTQQGRRAKTASALPAEPATGPTKLDSAIELRIILISGYSGFTNLLQKLVTILPR
jgi:hypothetical protein